MYTASNSYIDLLLTLRMELSVIDEWLAANKLTLNVSKTKYVIFGKPRQLVNTPDSVLSINNQPIQRVPFMKYLGVILDEKLDFNKHVEIMHSKAVNKLGILRRSRDFLDRKSSLTLYQSLILPQLSYCDIVFDTTSKSNKDKIQKIQNSALRCILKCDKRRSVVSMHNELKILTLSQCRDLNLAVECFKQATIVESSLNNMFVPQVRARATRRGDKLKVEVPRVFSEVGRRAFSYRGPVFWNDISDELKQKDNKNTFKSAYLKAILRDVNHPG